MALPESNIKALPVDTLVVNLDRRVTSLEGGGPPGGNMETRVAKLESDVEHIKTDVSDIKIDIRALRGDMNTEIGALRRDMNTGIGALREETNTGMGALSREHRNDFRMLVGLQFTTILGIIGILIKIFS